MIYHRLFLIIIFIHYFYILFIINIIFYFYSPFLFNFYFTFISSSKYNPEDIADVSIARKRWCKAIRKIIHRGHVRRTTLFLNREITPLGLSDTLERSERVIPKNVKTLKKLLSEKSEKSGKSEIIEKSEESEKSERREMSEKSEKNERNEKSERRSEKGETSRRRELKVEIEVVAEEKIEEVAGFLRLPSFNNVSMSMSIECKFR